MLNPCCNLRLSKNENESNFHFQPQTFCDILIKKLDQKHRFSVFNVCLSRCYGHTLAALVILTEHGTKKNLLNLHNLVDISYFAKEKSKFFVFAILYFVDSSKLCNSSISDAIYLF